MNVIDRFVGAHRFLSNFHPAEVILDKVHYPTVEHAYQAWKVGKYNAARIRTCETPGAAKRLARRLPLRPEAADPIAKISIMKRLVHQKFQYEPLRSQLLETGNARLIEGNGWGDTFWGVCDGRGENHLGKILEEVREMIRKETQCPMFGSKIS